jgi:hypothetical protein
VLHFLAHLNRIKILPGTRTEGWKVENAVQEPWKYTPKRLLENIGNNVFQSILYIIFIRLFVIRQTAGRQVRTRFAQRTWIQRFKVQRYEQDKEKEEEDTKCYISSHFWIELKFCLVQGWKGWRVEDAVQKLWKYTPKRLLEIIRNNVFQSIAYNVYPSFSNPVSRVYLPLELVLLDAHEFKESKCRHMSRVKKRKGKIRSASFLRTFESN